MATHTQSSDFTKISWQRLLTAYSTDADSAMMSPITRCVPSLAAFFASYMIMIANPRRHRKTATRWREVNFVWRKIHDSRTTVGIHMASHSITLRIVVYS